MAAESAKRTDVTRRILQITMIAAWFINRVADALRVGRES